ncbi:MAG TPA: Ig-like domain-containing protein, partial [Bacteroidales bacterium]|nr:Ig-like domain-containing protein [Bacteroidales bacterium]
ADLIATGKSDFTGTITNGPYLESYPADIILLEIGTNDMVAQNYSVTEINRLLSVIDQYEQQSGHPVLVIVGTIISIQNFPCGTHVGVNLFNNSLKLMVQNRISNGDKLILTDLECGAGINYYNDMWDELHPNIIGYEKMGQKWFNTIDEINAKPVVYDIPDQQIHEGENFPLINLNNYVSDLDDSDAAITWTIENEPQNLTVTISSSKVATIIPKDPNWNGTETVTFIARDPGKFIPVLHGVDSDEVIFEILPTNDPPSIISQKTTVIINEDSQYETSMNDLNINDPDDPVENMEILILDDVFYEHNGTIITPVQNFNGDLGVKLVVTDGKDQSNSFNFNIHIIAVNDPPVITSVPYPDTIVAIGEQYIYAFTVIDADEDILEFLIVEKPDWLEFISDENLLSGIPDTTDQGIAPVRIVVSDGSDSAEQKFNLKVSLFTGSDNPDGRLINVYPIPADKYLNVESKDLKILQFSIYDSEGKLIFSKRPSSLLQNLFIDVSDFPAGIYIMKAQTTEGIITKKIQIR